VTQAHAQLKSYDGERDSPDPGLVWFFHSAFGEFDEAERHIRRVVDPDDRHLFSAVLEFLKGKPAAARKAFAKIKNESWPVEGSTEAVVAERSGLWAKLEETALKNRQEDIGLGIAKGEHALAVGRAKEGIALLEKATDALRTMPSGAFYLGSESLAHEYQKQCNFEAALRVLKQASSSEGRAYDCANNGPMLGAWWLRTELQLADLLRITARRKERIK
jgi:tetratricopeptide (TPR) repeat protein